MSASTKTKETLDDNLVELFASRGQGTEAQPTTDQEQLDKIRAANGRLERLLNVCWLEEADDHDAVLRKTIEAVEIYRSLNPQNETESLLCEQMVGNHFAANRCFKRASAATHSETVARYCRTAAQLQAQFLKQSEFLKRQRARKPQRVVVVHEDD